MSPRKLTTLATLLWIVGLGAPAADAQKTYRTGDGVNTLRRTNPQSAGVEDLIARVWDSPGAIALDVLAAELSGSASLTTDLHVSVESGGADSITVAPGTEVRYEVVGVLSDDANEGLALVGFNLVFDGGDLTHADIPAGEPTPGCDNPMVNFTLPWGITNPDDPCPPACGYGGTVIDGDLIQVGGAQNTLNNTPDNAPYPIGPVLTGVASRRVGSGCGPAVLVTGTLIAPNIEGTYTLTVTELFANVIKQGETGDPYWATEAVGVGTIASLTINVALDLPERATAVALDIKPGSCPNPVNVRSRGVVPMAVVGAESFDVTEVDIDSLVLTRADGVGEAVTPITTRFGGTGTIEDVAAPFAGELCDCHDLAGDGFDDLVIKFSAQELADLLEPGAESRGASVMLTVSGSLVDGTEFEASDCVVVTGGASRSPQRASGKRGQR